MKDYANSICDQFKLFDIQIQNPRHTSLVIFWSFSFKLKQNVRIFRMQTEEMILENYVNKELSK